MFNSGRRGKRSNDGYGIISQAEKFNQTEYPIPIISSFSVTDISYNPTGALAANTAGGETIVVNGSGFAPGATVQVGSNTISVVTYIDQGRLAFTAPAASAGSYTIYVSNSNGGTGILVPGLTYSSVPTFQTSAGTLGSYYETQQINQPIVAIGDAPLTYSLLSGSLPTGSTLSSSGVITGTAPVDGSSTTYTFTARAFDAQSQTVDRQFSLTINTDVVTWLTPTSNYVISSYEYAPISNVTASATSAAGYGVLISANTIPSGITLNANTGLISGTNNTVGNTYTRLTATANTTNRSATRDVIFNINQDVVTWSSPADGTVYTLPQDTAISNVTLSASSAAGFGVQYTANALPTGITLSGSTISGTPTVTETVNTLLTATANTTGRTATRYISWSVSVASDSYWNYNTLLLSANSSIQTTSFAADNSNNNSQLTVVGDTRASNFNPYQSGYYSNYFDGSGDFLSFPFNASLALGAPAADFTVECWIYVTSLANAICLGDFRATSTPGTQGWLWVIQTSGRIDLQDGNGTSLTTSGTGAIVTNRWQHVVLVRTSSLIKLFVDGTQQNGSYTSTATYTQSTGTNYIGQYSSTGYMPGYISNFRIVKGTALYTTTFTPPTAPLTAVANTTLLTCQSNRLIDTSPSNFTITKNGDTKVSSAHPFTTVYQAGTQYYSTSFNGSSDYLTTSTNAAFTYGTSDFTIEMWVYITANPADYAYIYSQGPNTTASMCIYLQSGKFNVWNGSNIIAGATSYSLNTWYHIALARSGTSLKLFVNGVQDGSATNSSNVTTGTTYGGTVGRWIEISDTRYYAGYVSNLRVVKGTAVYTTTFTPPTSPLTAISGTSLLTCQDSTFKDNSTNAFTVTAATTTVKPLAVSPFTPRSYSNTAITTYGSGYFDGTGDYLTIPATSAMALGSGDFTIEAWIYTPSTVAQYGTIICNVNNPDGFYLSFSTSNFITFSNYGTVAITSSSAVPLNTWTHVAVTRSGTSVRMFFNGVSVGTATNSTVYGVSSATNYIGFNGGAAYYTGYVSDLRVIKGTALYTSNFVPQFTSPLTNVTNTQLLTLQTNGSHNNSAFLDNSSFNNLITRTGNVTNGTFSPYGDNWSNYFDGTSDELTLPSAVTTSLSGTYTIECWCYQTAAPTGTTWDTSNPLLTQVSGGSAYHVWALTTTGLLLLTRNGASYQTLTSSITFPVNQWFHVAITNVGTTVKLYVNGSLAGTLTQSAGTWSTTAGSAQLGAAGTRTFTGYISNFRIVNGTEVYTTTFTPPTAPLTAITNTSLLTCQSNRFVDNSINNYSVTRVGDVSVQKFSPFSTVTVPKYYSTLFVRSALDYINTPASSAFAFGTGAYTIEAWVYFNTITTYRTIFSVSDATHGPALVSMTDGSLRLWDGALIYTNTPTGTVTTGRWYHIAWVRESTSLLKLYVDGTSVLTITSGDIVAYNLTGTPTAYVSYFPGYGHQFDGYISNFRITKGQALYTSTFTPSTTALTTTSQGATESNVILLTCQSSTFIDNSTNKFAITAATTTVKPLLVSPFTPTASSPVSYSPATFGGSMYFDGTGDNLYAASMSKYGSSNHTIECWVYFNNVSGRQAILNQGWGTGSYATDGGWTFDIAGASAGAVSFALGTMASGSFWIGNATGVGSFTVGQWYHIAIVRNGTTVTIYSNGVSIGTGTLTSSATIMSNMGLLRVGAYDGGGFPFSGYITDVRISNGALYTSNFYPGSAPLTPATTIGTSVNNAGLLLNGTSGGVDDATRTVDLETVGDAKVTQFSPYNTTYYSNYFDGTGDYLTVSNSTNFAFGTGDFTIEFWINTTDTGGGLIAQAATGGWAITIYASTIYWQSAYNATNLWTYSAATIIDGKWHHLAFSRVSGSTKFFVDGALASTNADSTNYAATTGNIVIGRDANPADLIGYISNMRVIKGTGLYTSAFTPSTSPLTTTSQGATANQVALLTCQSNKFVDNSTNAFTITRNGDTKVATQNPFQVNTGLSYYFDGTGDYLYSPNSLNLQFLTGDYTVEYWINPNSFATLSVHLDFRTANAATGGALQIYTTTGGVITVYGGSSTGTLLITAGAGITLNAWTHVALTRSGTSTKLFINGTQSGSTATDATSYGLGALWIGTIASAGSNSTTGYLSDLRITKGTARYTTTFTPPTTPYILK